MRDQGKIKIKNRNAKLKTQNAKRKTLKSLVLRAKKISISWGDSKAFPVLIWTGEPIGEVLEARPSAVEIRLDMMRKRPRRDLLADLRRLRARGVSLLLTARRKVDGGRWPASEEGDRRAALLQYLLEVDAIDIEADVIRNLELPKLSRGCTLIVSHHDFKGVPTSAKLDRMILAARDAGAARFKIAASPQSHKSEDRLGYWAIRSNANRKVQWTAKPGVLPVTVIFMGKKYQETRFIFPWLMGGPAYAPSGKAVAPGQIPYNELKRELDTLFATDKAISDFLLRAKARPRRRREHS